MGLEVATYINGLVTSNPAGTDDRSQGDDHIRLIKSVLKNTFPNLDGAITITDEQINSIATPGIINFPGMIVLWSGSIANIPNGWKLCNGVGTISNGDPVPNLVDRFIIGSATNSGGLNNIGTTGGTPNIVYNGVTTPTPVEFAVPVTGYGIGAQSGPGTAGRMLMSSGRGEVVEELESVATAAGGPLVSTSHAHYFGVSITNGNIPPYFAAAYIIKN
jgi:hypothetical protein